MGTPDIYRQFGRNLMRLRAAMGLTQTAVAERAGISMRFYQALEAGRKTPALDTIAGLASALECRYDDLFSGIRRTRHESQPLSLALKARLAEKSRRQKPAP